MRIVRCGHVDEHVCIAEQDNKFSGEIPEQIGQLGEVEEVFLQGNKLTGNIPQRHVLCWWGMDK